MESCQQVAELIRTIALPISGALGLELLEVTCSGKGANTLIRVYIDKPGGVQLIDCEELHRSLGHALDVEDPIPHSYTLEVSSPGLDRPFKGLEEYKRTIGKRVRVKLKRPFEGQWLLIGELLDVQDLGIVVGVQKKKAQQSVPLSWDDILHTRREIEF